MQQALFDTVDVKESVGIDTKIIDPQSASNKSTPIHRWVPWIAGFSADFVKTIIKSHKLKGGIVLDPFAGVGTTLIEASALGNDVIGFEINPYAAFASKMKLNASTIDTSLLAQHINKLIEFHSRVVLSEYQPKSSPPEGFKTREQFYSPIVLHKVLTLLDFIETIENGNIKDIFLLAFAATMVQYSNYSYEPSLGTRAAAGKPVIDDFPVIETIIEKLGQYQSDIKWLTTRLNGYQPNKQIINDSIFNSKKHIKSNTVDLVITSPPYLNNYHYIRNTRPHLYWLGFASNTKDVKPLENDNFGKYWQTVRGKELVDLEFENPPESLKEDLSILRTLNKEKGVYGGNGWANYAASYFNDCYKLSLNLHHAMKSKATAYVVIGNSILQGLMIPTDEYFGRIAEGIGFELVDIHIPRKTRVGNSIINSKVRVGKAKKKHKLYEAVVEIRKG